jgi:hypothetical protein
VPQLGVGARIEGVDAVVLRDDHQHVVPVPSGSWKPEIQQRLRRARCRRPPASAAGRTSPDRTSPGSGPSRRSSSRCAGCRSGRRRRRRACRCMQREAGRGVRMRAVGGNCPGGSGCRGGPATVRRAGDGRGRRRRQRPRGSARKQRRRRRCMREKARDPGPRLEPIHAHLLRGAVAPRIARPCARGVHPAALRHPAQRARPFAQPA